jgi:hypothetical protein
MGIFTKKKISRGGIKKSTAVSSNTKNAINVKPNPSSGKSKASSWQEFFDKKREEAEKEEKASVKVVSRKKTTKSRQRKRRKPGNDPVGFNQVFGLRM